MSWSASAAVSIDDVVQRASRWLRPAAGAARDCRGRHDTGSGSRRVHARPWSSGRSLSLPRPPHRPNTVGVSRRANPMPAAPWHHAVMNDRRTSVSPLVDRGAQVQPVPRFRREHASLVGDGRPGHGPKPLRRLPPRGGAAPTRFPRHRARTLRGERSPSLGIHPAPCGIGRAQVTRRSPHAAATVSVATTGAHACSARRLPIHPAAPSTMSNASSLAINREGCGRWFAASVQRSGHPTARQAGSST